MNDVTPILHAPGRGAAGGGDRLWPLVYAELRQLAAAHLAHERPGQTLQPTALVHEAYLRLVGGGDEPGWNSRGHFFAAAAESVRRSLVESAGRRRPARHGGGRAREDLDADLLPAAEP